MVVVVVVVSIAVAVCALRARVQCACARARKREAARVAASSKQAASQSVAAAACRRATRGFFHSLSSSLSFLAPSPVYSRREGGYGRRAGGRVGARVSFWPATGSRRLRGRRRDLAGRRGHNSGGLAGPLGLLGGQDRERGEGEGEGRKASEGEGSE